MVSFASIKSENRGIITPFSIESGLETIRTGTKLISVAATRKPHFFSSFVHPHVEFGREKHGNPFILISERILWFSLYTLIISRVVFFIGTSDISLKYDLKKLFLGPKKIFGPKKI
jgi:hypothetical protein